MIRFVVGPGRALAPDIAGRLPGRGIWLSADRAVLPPGPLDKRLLGAFARAAKGPVAPPVDLAGMLDGLLARRIRDTLGLARRAGQAVAGFEKAREWVRAGRAAVVIEASDGSLAERERLLSGSQGRVAVFDPLPAAELGRAMGRDHVVHIALLAGKLAEGLAVDAGRLGGLRHGHSGRDGSKGALDGSQAPAPGGAAIDG